MQGFSVGLPVRSSNFFEGGFKVGKLQSFNSSDLNIYLNGHLQSITGSLP